MKTDLSVSPCRGCEKANNIRCRDTCRKLSNFQKALVNHIPSHIDTGDAYSYYRKLGW